MWIVTLGLGLLLAAGSCRDPDAELLRDFKQYKENYVKQYKNDLEEEFRLMVYADNKRKVELHNARYRQGRETYEVELNEFSDYLGREFLLTKTGYKRPDNETESDGALFRSNSEPLTKNLPASVDWREKGAVTEVKFQKDCESCWAFSATGALEGQQFLKSGKLVSLSEQNLVDCVPPGQNCEGSFMTKAFDYIRTNGGISTEASYGYEGDEGACRFKKEQVGATCSGHVKVPAGDEARLQEAVATVGPVCVAVDATHSGFRSYHKGVHYEPKCGQPNHAMLVVGYGTTENNEDYWLVKNSWGPGWGLKGYIMMARNKDNNCAIASEAVYPIV